jgi:hypothetical protein
MGALRVLVRSPITGAVPPSPSCTCSESGTNRLIRARPALAGLCGRAEPAKPPIYMTGHLVTTHGHRTVLVRLLRGVRVGVDPVPGPTRCRTCGCLERLGVSLP